MDFHFHLHPSLVHFPIALFLSAFIFEIVSLYRRHKLLHEAAFYIFVLAVVMTPLAVISGLLEANEWHLTNHGVFLKHRNLAFLTLGVSLISLLLFLTQGKLSRKNGKPIFLFILLLLSTLVMLTAYFGGELVYEYGIGIEQE